MQEKLKTLTETAFETDRFSNGSSYNLCDKAKQLMNTKIGYDRQLIEIITNF